MLIRPGATVANNPAVGTLFQQLLERGMLPPDATEEMSDGVYGEATQATIETFQAKHGLTRDRIVGPRTWAKLTGGGELVDDSGMPAPDYAKMTALMSAALHLADEEWRKGVVEVGQPNRGPEVDQYLIGHRRDGREMLCFTRYKASVQKRCKHCDKLPMPTAKCAGAPWCARFVLWCVEKAAAGFNAVPPTVGGGDLAGASKWLRWAVAHGKVSDKPRPGNVAIIRVASTVGHSAQGHVMLVANVSGTRIATREGNAGDRVSAKWRESKSITAFVDLG